MQPYQPCHAMYARYMRCIAEMGSEPPAAGGDAQSVAASTCTEPRPVHGVLWRAYPKWSFLAAHRRVVQDQDPLPVPVWYGDAGTETYLEDAEGRVLVDDPSGFLAGLPSGLVLGVTGAPSPTLAGALLVATPPRFPGGGPDDWVFADRPATGPGHGGSVVARFHQALPRCPWPSAAAEWYVIGDVLGARMEAAMAVLKAPKPPGCVVVPGGKDPCGSTGFPRPPLPDFLSAIGGFRSVSSPHYDTAARVLVQDGSVVDDARRALAPDQQNATTRAALFARACLLWRNLAPTAADTLPCPSRPAEDTGCPPWPVGAPPCAIVLGAGQDEAEGSVVMANNPRLGVSVLVVALGTQAGRTQGSLVVDPDGAGGVSWTWTA